MEMNPADTRKHFTSAKNRDPLMSPAKSIKLQPSHQVDLEGPNAFRTNFNRENNDLAQQTLLSLQDQHCTNALVFSSTMAISSMTVGNTEKNISDHCHVISNKIHIQ